MVAGSRVVQDQIRHRMVPRVVVAHLSRVAVQGLAEVLDLLALIARLSFCMLLAEAVAPADMPGVGFPGQCLSSGAQTAPCPRIPPPGGAGRHSD